MLDPIACERAEAELDAFIAKRFEGRDDTDDRLEEAWRESEELDRQRRRRKLRAQWFAYFSKLAASLRERADDYERRAEALCEEGG